MSISQLLVPNDLKLYVGNAEVQKKATYNNDLIVLPPTAQSLVYQTAEEIQFTHSAGQSYIVSFSGVVDVDHQTAPVSGESLLIIPTINGDPITDLNEIVSPEICVVSRFTLGFDYADPPNIAAVPFSIQFIVKNINDLPGSTLKFNIRVTNNSGEIITYAAKSTNMLVSCVSVV